LSLPHAILGLLQWESMTGYDLKTHWFDESIAHFWPADQAQIYRTLDKLTEKGWIECHVEIQQYRPNRKVYSLAEAGRTELARWLGIPLPLPSFREPLLIQLFFAKQLPKAEIVQLLEQQLTAHRQQLTYYEQIGQKYSLPPMGDASASREQVMQRLVLELGLRKEQTYIDWLKASIDVIHCL